MHFTFFFHLLSLFLGGHPSASRMRGGGRGGPGPGRGEVGGVGKWGKGWNEEGDRVRWEGQEG